MTTAPDKSMLSPVITIVIAVVGLAIHGGVLWEKVDHVQTQLVKLIDQQQDFERRIARLEARRPTE